MFFNLTKKLLIFLLLKESVAIVHVDQKVIDRMNFIIDEDNDPSHLPRGLHPDGTQSLLVTFYSGDLSLALDLRKMKEMALSQNILIDHSMTKEQFSHSDEYHQIRGEWVHGKINEKHQETKNWIERNYPMAKILRTIPISNSFLLRINSDEITSLSQDDEMVSEIHPNDPFDVRIGGIGGDFQKRGTRSIGDELTQSLDDNIRLYATSNPTVTSFDSIAGNTADHLSLSSGIEGHKFMVKGINGESLQERQTSFEAMEDDHSQWNIKKVKAPQVWNQGIKGRGEIYAIADTGIDWKHKNLVSNYYGTKQIINGQVALVDHNYAWFDGVREAVGGQDSTGFCSPSSPEPCDDSGHGTHVASTAIGKDGFGVAPDAQWIGCRNMHKGMGTPETYLNCLNFFLAPTDLQGRNPRPELRPISVGNSYGCPSSEGCSTYSLTAAVNALRAAGIFMSVSAGNNGPSCETIDDPPATEPEVISVAATGPSDELAYFSSRGPCKRGPKTYRKPDISAPGIGIQAAFPNQQWARLSGTSMASPHLGGAILLISEACPCIKRNVDAMQTLIEQTALPLLPPNPTWDGKGLCGDDKITSIPNNYYGWGRLDILAAIDKCRQICKATTPSKHKLYDR